MATRSDQELILIKDLLLDPNTSTRDVAKKLTRTRTLVITGNAIVGLIGRGRLYRREICTVEEEKIIRANIERRQRGVQGKVFRKKVKKVPQHFVAQPQRSQASKPAFDFRKIVPKDDKPRTPVSPAQVPKPPTDCSHTSMGLPEEGTCPYPFAEKNGTHVFCGCETILKQFGGKTYLIPPALKSFQGVSGYCPDHAYDMLIHERKPDFVKAATLVGIVLTREKAPAL